MNSQTVTGIITAAAVAVLAILLGKTYPLVGGPVFAIVIGIGLGTIPQVRRLLDRHGRSGLAFCSKKVLQWAIIILGATLNLGAIARTGRDSLAVMVFTFTAAFLATVILGRLWQVPSKLASLIGVGTAICGGSAIAAIAPIIAAEATEISYALSTVFLFNVLAVGLFPWLGHLMGLSEQAFGLWAGTAINDTSSVVAAGYAFSQAAGTYATIVKLARTTFIIPIALGFAVRSYRPGQGDVLAQVKRVFPWFILWFLVAASLNTFGLFPQGAVEWAGVAAKTLIVVALAAIGLGTDFRQLVSTGLKPLLLGLGVWASVAVVSLIVQRLTGQL